MRTVFLGTPEFAVPSLIALSGRHEVVGVVTQPDRPAGRGRKVLPPAVKRVASGLGLPVFQPERVSASAAVQHIARHAPDVIIVVAYGQLLRPDLLNLPPHGCLNVHASLLPRWRGASPVQAALLHGDAVTGVTIMRMDEGLDTGPIVSQRSIPIRSDHTGGSLTTDLAELGADLLIETLDPYVAGAIIPSEQDSRMATLAPRLSPADGILDPAQPASALALRVRALSPEPGARILWGSTLLRVLEAHVVPGEGAPAGTVRSLDGFPAMAASEGVLVLDRVQLPGGRPMSGQAFLAGHRKLLGDVLRRPA